MPAGGTAFNGDHFIEREFERLVAKHNIQTIIETGTYLGQTTPFLATIAPHVVTIEINEEWDSSHLDTIPNIKKIIGDSADGIPEAVSIHPEPYMFFLDAHWHEKTPTPRELQAIAKLAIKPVIVIHDFKVPGTLLGYDSYRDFTYDYNHIRDHLTAIYGEDGYEYHYNDEKHAAGAKRGVIYIEARSA